jgi:hypothetical protein
LSAPVGESPSGLSASNPTGSRVGQSGKNSAPITPISEITPMITSV